jgi:TetR/AcrR family tetracycline transcriptional repressor
VSKQAILDAVETKGRADWTMAGVASELGVSEPAIYYHFPSRQALLEALAARVVADLPLPPRSSDWEGWLTAFAESLMGCYRRHPLLKDVDMAAATATQPASVSLLEELLGQLVSCGFTVEDAATACAMVFVVVHAAAPAPTGDQLERERRRLLELSAEAPLASKVYAPETWTEFQPLPRLLSIALAGIRAELAPAQRRRGRS